MNVTLHLRVCGMLLLILAGIHVVFPHYFNWREDLAKLSLVNRQIMKVHTFFISLTVLLMGVLCSFSAVELVSTPLGRRIATGMAVFWGSRLLIQFFGYSPRLWRGKAFETAVHVAFSLLWLYLTLVFGVAGRLGFSIT